MKKSGHSLSIFLCLCICSIDSCLLENRLLEKPKFFMFSQTLWLLWMKGAIMKKKKLCFKLSTLNLLRWVNCLVSSTLYHMRSDLIFDNISDINLFLNVYFFTLWIFVALVDWWDCGQHLSRIRFSWDPRQKVGGVWWTYRHIVDWEHEHGPGWQ